jgi:hypothetical protein
MEFLLYALTALNLLCRARGETTAPSNPLASRNATTKLLHHRGFHSSIVIGDYLYIDGGEITTWDGIGNGLQTANPQDDGNIVTLPSKCFVEHLFLFDELTSPGNYTYSIDLSSSWTNSTVNLHQIRKTAPVLNNVALWLDGSSDTIYAYDGALSSK